MPDGLDTLSYAYEGARTKTQTYTIAGSDPSTEVLTGRREEMDGLGRLVSVTENVDLHPADGIQGEVTTQYTYDIGSRLATVSIPGEAGTQSRTFTYDKRGLLTQEQHPEIGVNGNGTMSYSLYDSRGHVGKKTTGTTIDLRYDYDKAERLTQVTDGKQGLRPLQLFSWDCIRLDVTNPCATVTHQGQLGGTARFNYDPELGTIAVNEANMYDSASGRLVRRDFAVGSGTAFTGAAFFYTQSYNDLGLPNTVFYPCVNAGGACPGNDPGRAVTHGYTRGFLTSVGTWATDMTYQPNGLIETVKHESGAGATIEKWEADPNGMARPGRIVSTNAAGTQELWSTGAYAYDGAGNVKAIGNTRYAYDAFGRLDQWTTIGATGSTTTFREYDAFGNELLTKVQVCSSGPIVSCSGPSVLAREVRGTTNQYLDTSYDDAGNVVQEFGPHVYSWDPLGMMTSATVDGRTFRYLYDASNERIAAVERVPVGMDLRNRTTFTLRGASNQLLSTWTDDRTSGTSVFTRKEDTIWRGARLLALATPLTEMNYALDHLGSPRLITSSAGGVIDEQDFEPFGGGGLLGSGALQFTGQERDFANLGGGVFNLPDYFHARYYIGGRFLSVDPVLSEWTLFLPQGWNRYAYALNNPMRYTDPTGMKPCKIKLTGQDAKDAGVDDGTEVDGECVEAEEPKTEPQPLPPMVFAGVLPLETQQLRMRERDERERVQIEREQQRISNCYDDHRFSSVIGDLTGSETAQSVTGFLEVGSEISLASDVVATAYKATHVSLGNQAYASGMNAAFRGFGRAIENPALGRSLTKFGDKATPTLAVFGVFTAAYNATTYIQCRAGLL